MTRGFSCIGLFRPKTPENVGGVLRAAHCYGSAFVAIEGARTGGISHCTNTPRADRHMPVLTPEDLISVRPWNTQIVVVERIKEAIPLPDFTHPERAMYIFGPEDGTLGRRHTEAAQHIVYIPTRDCMNLSACVNVLLYDRMIKRQGSSGVEQGIEDSRAAGSIPALATI